MSTRHCLALTLGLILRVLLPALPLAADVHPNVEGGVAVEKAFHVGEIDHINLFNGSLTVTLPLGITYPVGNHLSYGLTLVYNSNPWFFVDDASAFPNVYPEAVPTPCSNAGLGWQVSLGQLGSPCVSGADTTTNQTGTVYEGADGSQHVFYANLHQEDPKEAQVSYTRDGSYLRLRSVGTAGEHELDFPEGMIHHFDSQGRLTQIRDAFGNQVNLAYGDTVWTITDSQGRTQQIFFRSDLPGYPRTVDRVVLSSFGGGTATYQFQYAVQSISRGYPNRDLNLGSNVSVPLLTKVLLPDGSFYQMALSDYFLPVFPSGSTGQGTFGSGTLQGLTLPTLGRIEWTYQTYGFPQGSAQKESRQKNYGVATRTTRDASGTVLGQWSYQTSLTPDPVLGAQELVNTLTDPAGTRTERHFSVSLHNVYAGDWNVYEYGAQLTRYTSQGTPPAWFLSSRTFDASGKLLRSEYAAYERDEAGSGLLPDASNLNRRLLQSRTVYEDDSSATTDLVNSNFDGLGHYRVQATGGSGFPGSLSRTHLTDYNHAQGTYAVDASNHPLPGFTMPLGGSWALSTYGVQWDAENGATALTEACFFPGSTTVSRERVHRLDGAAADPADALTVYDLDLSGNPLREKHYGGEVQGGLPTGNLCALSLAAAPEYEIDTTYQSGALATSKYAGQAWNSVERSIDASTGLPRTSLDSARVVTSFTYDTLGRLTSEQTGSSASTSYTYTPASSPSALAHLHLEQRPSGVPAAQRPARDFYFDGFGRRVREEVRMPDGSVSPRTFAYDGLGRQASVSELGTPALLTQTTFDPFNRPLSITSPDGHITQLSYIGVRQVTRTVSIGQQFDAAHHRVIEYPQTTTELYDRYGRLSQVIEPLGGGVPTSYTYDVGNRLLQVLTTALVNGSNVTQTRTFTYDRRGNLLTESHPEKGNGNGTVTHSGYDSRGHATRLIDGGNDLTSSFDSAERLAEVRRTGTAAACTPGGSNCLKLFTYGTANSGTDLRLGKLVQAQRWNFPVLGGSTHVEQIATTYTYAGLDGRLSQRDLTLAPDGDTTPGAHESFTQSWIYDDLGEVVSETYPSCTFAACSGTTARTVTSTYAIGRLTALPGYTGTVQGQSTGIGITYFPNGLVHQVAHSNGVVWTQLPDAFGLARPGGYTSALGATFYWSTGGYAYDGAGNVTQIGSSYYLYDNVSRLGTASFSTLAADGGTPTVQSYSYDPFGNLTALSGANGRNLPTSAATNRLSGPGVVYDAAGNLTSWNGALYEYDAFNQLRHYLNGAEEWLYLYDADDERVWSFKVGASPRFDRWTLRGQDAQVRRDYEVSGFAWGDWSHGNTWEDFIYRDGRLLAGYYSPGQQRHYDLDHLGSPRLITNFGSTPIAYHVYYPYGEEATAFNQDAERLKFTGHERDLASVAGAGDDLDYMHARHANPVTGRFLSTDTGGGKAGLPQSWNRYSYAVGNPLKFVDRNGLEPLDPNLLQFFNVFFHSDFSRVDIHAGLLGRLVATVAGAKAVTLGDEIYLRPNYVSAYRQRDLLGVTLIGHELVHVIQFQSLGPLFLKSYLQNYEYNKTLGQGYDPYENIIQEKIALRVEGVVKGFLSKNETIVRKLQAGQFLNAEDMKLVGAALGQSFKDGELNVGFQFIQGFLVYVQPPAK